jgi:TetR/AcrR family transcriptional regulator
MKPKKRIRRDPAEAKLLILQTAAHIMLDEGYAAVTMRGVAKAAGLSSTLVNYYYSSADALLLDLYRHSSSQDLESLNKALNAPDLLPALWAYQTDSKRTVLSAEFLALANHRKEIRAEIARHAEHSRQLQARALADSVDGMSAGGAAGSPLCIVTLLTSVARNLIVEDRVGMSLGHAEVEAYVTALLKDLRAGKPKRRQ